MSDIEAIINQNRKHQELLKEERARCVRLKDAARKRSPSEKPKDGEVVLVGYPNGFGLAKYRADCDYKWWDQDGETTICGINCWFRISHLFGEGDVR